MAINVFPLPVGRQTIKFSDLACSIISVCKTKMNLFYKQNMNVLDMIEE
jgi:hypothetical protein